MLKLSTVVDVMPRVNAGGVVFAAELLPNRLANPKNYTVKSSWQRIQGGRDSITADLNLLEELWPVKPV